MKTPKSPYTLFLISDHPITWELSSLEKVFDVLRYSSELRKSFNPFRDTLVLSSNDFANVLVVSVDDFISIQTHDYDEAFQLFLSLVYRSNCWESYKGMNRGFWYL